MEYTESTTPNMQSFLQTMSATANIACAHSSEVLFEIQINRSCMHLLFTSSVKLDVFCFGVSRFIGGLKFKKK